MNINCAICNQSFENVLNFVLHLRFHHQIKLKEYIEKYIEVPLCPICHKQKLKLPIRLAAQFYRSGNWWLKTCGNPKCISQFGKLLQNNIYNGQNGQIIKQKIRKKRFEYLKKKTGQTAWERRSQGKMSYLQQWFYDNIIVKYKLFDKYDIINQFPVYPYFIDFAFINIKLAVELDGKCHFVNGKTRTEHDKKKDDCLLNNGWTIYRINYEENNNDTVDKFLNFLNSFQPNKTLENRIYKYSEIKRIKTQKKRCPKCGKDMGYQSTLCRRCSNLEKNVKYRKVERPNKQTLQHQIQQNSFVSLGKKYGVSDNAIRKWCKWYGISYKKVKKFSKTA